MPIIRQILFPIRCLALSTGRVPGKTTPTSSEQKKSNLHHASHDSTIVSAPQSFRSSGKHPCFQTSGVFFHTEIFRTSQRNANAKITPPNCHIGQLHSGKRDTFYQIGIGTFKKHQHQPISLVETVECPYTAPLSFPFVSIQEYPHFHGLLGSMFSQLLLISAADGWGTTQT